MMWKASSFAGTSYVMSSINTWIMAGEADQGAEGWPCEGRSAAIRLRLRRSQ